MMMENTKEKINNILSRNITDAIERAHLTRDLQGRDKLRIKLGADPTAPDLHLGHSVVLRKLREFQELGHTVVFIIGDFTALIGDPTGKSKTRPPLAPETIAKNAKTYFEQVGKILNMKQCEIHYNSEWFSRMAVADLIKLEAQFSMKRILERDDFEKRMKDPEAELFAHETVYPMLQAYDSVAIKADVEIGGTDQRFNMLAGRDLQRKMGMPEQDVITCPLLTGLDGAHKMSKSLGNYIGLADEPNDMYGKVLSIPDSLIVSYFELATDVSEEEISKIKKDLAGGKNPKDLKMRLASEIVRMYHGAKPSKAAEENFSRVHQKHEAPEDIPEVRVKKEAYTIIDLLLEVKFTISKNEARRVVEERGVKVDGKIVADINMAVSIPKRGVLIQKGKRHFVRVLR